MLKAILVSLLLYPAIIFAQEEIVDDHGKGREEQRILIVQQLVGKGPLIGDELGLLIQKAGDQEPVVRALVAEGLGKLLVADDPVISTLHLLTDDEVESVRIEAIRSLGRVSQGDSITLQKLSDFLQQGSKQERITTLAALGSFREKSQSISSQIAPLLNDSDWLIRSFALDALLLIDGEVAKSAISESIKGASKDTLLDTAQTARATGDYHAQFLLVLEFLKQYLPIMLVAAALLYYGSCWLRNKRHR